MIKNIPNAGIIKSSNWQRVKTAADVIRAQIAEGNWDHRKFYDEAMRCDVFSMDHHGVIVLSTANDSTRWMFWNGKWLDTLLPWTNVVRKKLAEQGLPLAAITYHNHTFSIQPHRDTAYLGEDPDIPHTNVNFIVSCKNPDTSYTWCRSDDTGEEMRYYSHPGSLWIMNASVMHSVETSGLREALIMKFRVPFELVENFFDKNPDFFDENQPYFQS